MPINLTKCTVSRTAMKPCSPYLSPLRYEMRGGSLKSVSQLWLVLYKVPFPHEYVLEVGQRSVVLRYKGHERVVFS